jgi:nucleoside-diphosphate kinase
MERTFVAIKPDGVQRGLVGEVISRLERRGLKLVAIRLMQVDEDLAGRHYAEHVNRPFFTSLVSFITSGPIVAMIWEANNAVALARQTMGSTNPAEAAPGTIRGDLGIDIGRNIVHGSDGPESAEREIGLFFGAGGALDYSRSIDQWIIES